MAKMIIMRGLPASGKSTKAKELVEKYGNTVRLNKDLLRTMLHFDKFTGRNEGMTRDASRFLATSFITAGVNVIIDDTNLNPGTLQSWKDLAKMLEAKLEYHDCFDVSVAECVERDMRRDKKVGESVIKKMALQHLEYLKGQEVVLCDLDGTLAEISHRLPLVKGIGKKDWDGFFAAIPKDGVRDEVSQKVSDLVAEKNCKLIFISARPERCRKDTEEWLDRNYPYPYETLIMRSDGDSRPDTEVKSDMFNNYLSKLKVVRIFDDRPSVIRMWEEKGLPVEDVGSGVEF